MRIIDRLDLFMEKMHLNDNRISVQAGLSNGVIGKSRMEGRDLSQRAIEKILLVYTNLNPEWLLTGEGEMLVSQRKKIPLFNSASTIGGYTDTIANMDAAVPSEWIDAGDWFPDATSAIYHQGDSMKEYPSGCILVVRRVNDPRLIINGAIYVIETDEYRITKQITDDGDYITAYSTNKELQEDGRPVHAPFRIPKEAIRHLDLVLGCVVMSFANKVVRIK